MLKCGIDTDKNQGVFSTQQKEEPAKNKNDLEVNSQA